MRTWSLSIKLAALLLALTSVPALADLSPVSSAGGAVVVLVPVVLLAAIAAAVVWWVIRRKRA